MTTFWRGTWRRCAEHILLERDIADFFSIARSEALIRRWAAPTMQTSTAPGPRDRA